MSRSLSVIVCKLPSLSLVVFLCLAKRMNTAVPAVARDICLLTEKTRVFAVHDYMPVTCPVVDNESSSEGTSLHLSDASGLTILVIKAAALKILA